MDDLTPNQERFAKEYIIDLNATRAYKAAYPNTKKDETAAVSGCNLLRNPKVAAYIQKLKDKRSERTQVKADDVIKELAIIGFSKATDYAEVVEKPVIDESGNPVTDADGNKITYKTVELIPTENLTEEQQRALAVLKRGRDGLEAKPYDKVRALELLGKHLGIFTDKVNIETTQKVVIVDDLDE